ncbi:MAG TPA: Ig-like domain-containing protein, partial [Pirellulaceae bacterium]|nr:Ig-like domain-containing protein [Pirellulaceae bacterium]
TGVSALNPTGSTVTLLGNLIAFQAPADFNGIATFAYIVEDNGTTNGALDPKQGVGVVSVTVTPVNDPPIAIDDSRLVNEDEVLTIVADDPTTGLIANDFGGPLDEQNEPLTVVGVTPNSNAGGAVTLVGGIVTYTPPANFNGTDQFTYDVEDAAGERATGTVNLTINAVNDAPVAVPDAYATHEDEKLTIAGKGVLDNDFDIDIPANTLTVIQAQTLSKLGAALTVNSDGTVEYDPTGAPMLQALQPGQSARDEFVYSISDGTGAGNSVSNDATVTITVGGRNDAPVGQDDGPYSILEDQTLVVDVVTGVLTNDSDPENDTLSALIVSQPGNGAVTLQANGSFTYTPRTNFNGLDTFQYRASDGILSSNIVTVSIDVLSDPENPIAVGDSYTTDGNTTLTVSAQAGVLANDTDDDGPLSARVVNGPSNGTLNLNSDGSFVYTPTVGFVGGDSFTYEAVDGENLVSNAAIVTIQVNSTALWQNPRNNKDVNNDGIVSPQDALIVINRLNSGPDGSILDPETTPPPPPYYDVNGDGIVSPADVLIVINCINSEGSGGEGEGAFGDPVHQGEGEASLVNVDAFDFLPLHSDDHLGSHLDVGPRRNATAVGEEDYFGRLGLSNARPSIPASRLASSQTSDAAATSRVDEILDEFADDVAGVFGDDSFLDGLL